MLLLVKKWSLSWVVKLEGCQLGAFGGCSGHCVKKACLRIRPTLSKTQPKGRERQIPNDSNWAPGSSCA